MMTRREACYGLLSGIFGAGLATKALERDEVDVVYHRLWRKIRDTETLKVETTKKPDASRLIIDHDADGSPRYSIGLTWWVTPTRKSPLISAEPVKDEVTAYRLWYGISNRYSLSLEADNPQH